MAILSHTPASAGRSSEPDATGGAGQIAPGPCRALLGAWGRGPGSQMELKLGPNPPAEDWTTQAASLEEP